jgi:hypothetical protein
MKKECEQTRKALPNYLRGHVFRTTRNRIERHLGQCVICRSEFEALKRADETRRILKDINESEGVVHTVKEGVSTLLKLKKVAYRPLWIVAIVLLAAGVYYYAMMPRQLDLEIEKIVKTAPQALAPAPLVTPAPPAAAPAPEQRTVVTASTASRSKSVPATGAAPVQEPLIVMIVAENDQAAVRKINEVMRGHGQLRNMKFSDTDREVSGSMTTKDLLTFFSRIEQAGRITYNRRRFESFPSAQAIPFVLKLQAATKPAEKPLPLPKPAHKSAATNTPAEADRPALPATEPKPADAQQ